MPNFFKRAYKKFSDDYEFLQFMKECSTIMRKEYITSSNLKRLVNLYEHRDYNSSSFNYFLDVLVQFQVMERLGNLKKDRSPPASIYVISQGFYEYMQEVAMSRRIERLGKLLNHVSSCNSDRTMRCGLVHKEPFNDSTKRAGIAIVYPNDRLSKDDRQFLKERCNEIMQNVVRRQKFSEGFFLFIHSIDNSPVVVRLGKLYGNDPTMRGLYHRGSPLFDLLQ